MTIETDQLVLRSWSGSDGGELFELARDPEVGPAAGWTPHASEQESLEVICGALSAPEAYAVIDRRTGELLGGAELKGGRPGMPLVDTASKDAGASKAPGDAAPEVARASGLTSPAAPRDAGASGLASREREFELAYWIGRPFWGYGYATEAARALVRRAITELGATRIWAACGADNARSRAVLEACGLEPVQTETSPRTDMTAPTETGTAERSIFVREVRRTLYIDADACPVTREAIECARRAGWPVVIAGNSTQNLERHIGRGDPRDAAHARHGFWVEVLDVTVGADSADFAIVECLEPGDAVVTQDIGLASMALGRDAAAISVRGHVFRRETIDVELLVRHEEKRVRRAGGRTRGPAAFTSEDRRRFSRNLARLLG